MSKYNRIESIPIDSIPTEELAIAIKEWSEGDKAMENLLWTFHDKKIKTSGCHVGPNSYISFIYNEKLEMITDLFETVLTIPGAAIGLSPDGGNPLSGPEWYMPGISFDFEIETQEQADECFNILNDTLKKCKKSSIKHSLIKLFEFFIEKETGLDICVKHLKSKNYVFSFVVGFLSDERYNYYHNFFTSEGFVEYYKGSKRYSWELEAENYNEISQKINSAVQNMISKFSLEPETNEKNIESFRLLARLKRKKLTQEEFDKWLEEEKNKRLARFNNKK